MSEPILDWQSLPPDQIEAHFNPRMTVSDAAERLEAWAERSGALRSEIGGEIDVRFGEWPKATYDVHVVSPEAATVVFIHGGYWRNLDKATHLFAVAGLMRGGLNVVNLNYDLCPAVTLTDINRQIADGVRHLLGKRGELGLGGGDLFVMGHSVGAHAAALLATDAEIAPSLAGIIAVSGVYDTRAVAQTSINEDVRMSDDEADIHNMLVRPPRAGVRMLCSVGGDEPPAWIGQTLAYHALAGRHTDDCRLDIIDDANHFSVLEASCDLEHSACQRVLAFIGG